MKTACPRCGANVSFMPSTQKFYCEYCGCQVDVSEFEIEEFEKNTVRDKMPNISKTIEAENSNSEIKDDTSSTNYDEYTCSSCGAQLIVDATTTITDCAYCGSRQIMRAKFKGDFNPKEIIPFKIDRNQFIKMYTDFVHKKILAPDEFKHNPRLMETRGIYVPFHLFFFDIDTYARGEAIKKTNDSTSYKYFESEFSMKVVAPEDSSKKFNDDVMTSLEPFNYKELTKFNPVFLNGFLSENGNENLEQLERKAEARGMNEACNELRKKLDGHTFVKGKLQTNFKKLESRYVLLPVWFINTWYNNKLYSYAVNGQTGKIVGEIPLSKPKFYTVMGVLIALAVLATLFLLFVSVESDDSEDGVGDILALIWGGVVAAYVGIKKRYKNVNNVLENPIPTWEMKDKKKNNYSRGQYKKIFGENELKGLSRQIFRNGVDVRELNRMNNNSRPNINANINQNMNTNPNSNMSANLNPSMNINPNSNTSANLNPSMNINPNSNTSTNLNPSMNINPNSNIGANLEQNMSNNLNSNMNVNPNLNMNSNFNQNNNDRLDNNIDINNTNNNSINLKY